MRKIFTFLFAALMSVGMFAVNATAKVKQRQAVVRDAMISSTQQQAPRAQQTEPVDVTIGSWYLENWGNDGELFLYSPDSTIGFYFDLFYGEGASDLILGKEYTVGDVYVDEIGQYAGIFTDGEWDYGIKSLSLIKTIDADQHVHFVGSVVDIIDRAFTFHYDEAAAPAVPAWVREGDEWDDATKTLTVNGNPVSNAYINVSDIENLVISDAVTSIGDNAFESCYVLKSVAFGSKLASIGDEAFKDCNKLESVTFPASLKSIGKAAFSQCYALTSVTITNGLESIGQRAFYNCDKQLTSVTIPSSVTSIGSSAFGNCKVLTEIVVAAENPNYSSADGVLFDKDKTTLIQCPGGKQGEYTIPNSVTSIGNNAFSSCYLLTSVEIPNSVGEIGSEAFSSCIELTSVTIGNGIAKIGGYAFYYSSKLASVTINATTPPTLGGSALDKTAAALTIYVPAESVADYKGAWAAYEDKIEAISGGDQAVDNIQIDKAQSTKLIRNGMLLIEKNGKLYNVTGTQVK